MIFSKHLQFNVVLYCPSYQWLLLFQLKLLAEQYIVQL